jgi:hypothetical protein
MSTRSCVARRTAENGWEGRYVHFDGYPEARVPVLLDLIYRKGVERVRNVVIDWNPQGWSVLSGERETLNEWQQDGRFAVVSDYGIAYRDSDPLTISSNDIPDCFIEYVYILDDESMTVLEYKDGQHVFHSQISYPQVLTAV